MLQRAVLKGVTGFRKQLLLICAALILIIGIAAVAGIAALLTQSSKQTQARTIDKHVALIEKLRATTLEITASARRYMVSGDHKEQQRVLALVSELEGPRKALDARSTLPSGPVLEANIDAFVLGMTSAISRFEADPIDRLSRFEEEVVPVRQLLGASFDEVLARERAERTALRTPQLLAIGARWALIVASLLGIALVVGLYLAVTRMLARYALFEARSGIAMTASASGSEPAMLR